MVIHAQTETQLQHWRLLGGETMISSEMRADLVGSHLAHCWLAACRMGGGCRILNMRRGTLDR